MRTVFVRLSNDKPSYDYICKSCGYKVKYFPYPFPHRESSWQFKTRFWLYHPILLIISGYRAFGMSSKHWSTDIYRLIAHHHFPRRYGIHPPSFPPVSFHFRTLNLEMYLDYASTLVIGYCISSASKLFSLQTNGYIPFMAFSPDKIKSMKERDRCYCGTIVRNSQFAYDNLVFCSQKHLDNFKESRVDPLCGVILPYDPLQSISIKQNITMDRGFIFGRKKYVFCSLEHRNVFAEKNSIPLNLPEPEERRSFLKMATSLGVGIAAAFTLGRYSSAFGQTSPNSADPSFGANGIGLPSLTIDPNPLPPNGYMWYRSDLSVVRIASNGSARSLGVRPFISISPNGPDMYGDYGPNISGTSTAGFQEAMDFLAANGTNSTYAHGGILQIFPGAYTSNSIWTLPAPKNNSGSTIAFDFTLQGAGASNTAITISPSGTQVAAIKEGYSSWVMGTQGPRFVARDLNMTIEGTYSGSNAPTGDNSGGGVFSLQFYSVFFTNFYLSTGCGLTRTGVNLLKCGTFAGPSQPCTWTNFQFTAGFTGTTYPSSIISVWFEGFSWRGGLVDCAVSNAGIGGITISSNGPNYLGQIDSFTGEPGTATNVYSSYISSSGVTTLDELEYPDLAVITNAVNSGTINVGPNGHLTIIGFVNEAAVNQGNPNGNFSIWVNDVPYVKTIGFSLGLQSGQQWQSSYLSGPMTNNSSGINYIGLNTYAGVISPTASRNYTANTDCIINISGGTAVSITIYDIAGNVISQGLTSLSAFRMSIGMQISLGAFSSPPTVTVFQIAG